MGKKNDLNFLRNIKIERNAGLRILEGTQSCECFAEGESCLFTFSCSHLNSV